MDLLPTVTIHPDRIILRKEVIHDGIKPSRKYAYLLDGEGNLINSSFYHSERKNNGFLSTHAKRKLFRSIDYLLISSDKKRTYSKVQRKYISYRIVFVTLTLPSIQIHSDKEIINKCFNQLMIELSRYHNVHKYVWRAEKQENGNIHFHLLINQFIEYQELRKRWNRICNKLGYVDVYQSNMKEYFRNGFRPSNNPNDKRSIQEQRKAYIIGQKSDWTSPNSTDIHDTRKIQNIRKYVSKYMSKNPSADLNLNESELDKLSVKSRLWSCSQNLSDLKGCQFYEGWDISNELETIVKNSGCRIYKDLFYSVIFIDAVKLRKFGSDLLFKYFSDYLIECLGYHLPLKCF